MTEKEKMLAGEPYDFAAPELLNRWHEAKRLQLEYNNTPSTDAERLSGLLGSLLGSKGRDVWITAPFFVDYGENIHLGRNVEINMNCVFLDCNRITIGDYSGIGPGVHIYTVFHATEPSERLSEGGTLWKSITAPVTIGRNVWIGGGSIILPGVTIGDGTTIGAGSVVTRSIPAGVVAVGNPCKVIKKIGSCCLIRSILVVLLVVAALCGTGVRGAENGGCYLADQQPPLLENADEIAVALAFINGYVEKCLDPKSDTDVVAWVKSNPLVTPEFRNELQRIVDEAVKRDPELGLDGDPLFDAQDFPDMGFELDLVDRRNGCLILRGIDWPDFKLAVTVVNQQGKWLVDGCGAVRPRTK